MALPNKPKGELKAVVNPEVVEHDVDSSSSVVVWQHVELLSRSRNGLQKT